MKSKMECRQCREKIDDYIEGRLEADERLSFREHLDSCSKCREHFNIHLLADRIIAEEKNSEPGFYLTDRIMTGIENAKEQPSSPVIRILRPVAVTISVAAAIFAGVVIGSINGKSNKKTVPMELSLMNDRNIESLDVLSAE
ncbi:MAG TPA: zf-HC2 domain-containing protein [Bacteroidales bacterium]|nr:zf-HC2 domain-containing protein [Bacteroidales bacterium]